MFLVHLLEGVCLVHLLDRDVSGIPILEGDVPGMHIRSESFWCMNIRKYYAWFMGIGLVWFLAPKSVSEHCCNYSVSTLQVFCQGKWGGGGCR